MIVKVNKEQSLYMAIEQSSLRYPKRTAFIYQFHKFNYAHLLKRVQSFAYYLNELGYKRDDIITVCLPNIPDAIYLIYAINQIGAIGNFIHPLFNYCQMKENLDITKSKILFCLDTKYNEFSPLINEGVEVIACSPTSELSFIEQLGYKHKSKENLPRNLYKDTKDFYRSSRLVTYDDRYLSDAIYLNSGGTSGKSKIIALSSYAINALAYNGQGILDIDTTLNQHMLAVLPIFHGFGLAMGIHAMLVHGGVNTLMPKFNKDMTIKYIKKNQINFLIGIPSLYEALLSKKEFNGNLLKNLNIAFVGGDFVNESLIKRFNDRMISNGSMCRLRVGYGLTETVTVCSVNTHKNNKDGTVGRPLENVRFKVVDGKTLQELPLNHCGELLVSGETLMNGYRFETNIENPFVIDENNVKWIRTGDYVSIDEDNYLTFKQRIKRIVKVSGVPVYPSSIEDVVSSFDFVYECAATGIEDEKLGHAIKLFISLNRNKTITKEDAKIIIMKEISSKCGVYASPKEIVFIDNLPHTLVGKIDINKLK